MFGQDARTLNSNLRICLMSIEHFRLKTNEVEVNCYWKMIRQFVTLLHKLTKSFPGRIYIAQSPWYFGDYRNIFLPYIGQGIKSLDMWARAPGTVPFGKSGPGNCIMFIKRLDVGLR